MKIPELDSYKKLKQMFNEKGYSRGKKYVIPNYNLQDFLCSPEKLTTAHYIYAINYGKVEFCDVSETFLTREFFLHTLSKTNSDIIEFVKTHSQKFDKQFFKDRIEIDSYPLDSEFNDFEYMPLEFIDEEMVACAMLKTIKMYAGVRCSSCHNWFYSVYRRKPEVLTRELYVLGALCFAEKRNGKNKFLDITPKEYRTSEFYFALCLDNKTPVMEDIPETVLTTEILVKLLNNNISNIKCFSELALEKKVEIPGKGIVKFWQAAIITDGYQIKNIPLNHERIAYFLSIYDKDSSEYEYGFKKYYKRYIKQKNSISLIGSLTGNRSDLSHAMETDLINSVIDRQVMIPIRYSKRVPTKYSKKYDKEEYLLEIYKKIGIQVIREKDNNYYSAILPENLSLIKGKDGYCIKNNNGEILIRYYDIGKSYNKRVAVYEITVTLE